MKTNAILTTILSLAVPLCFTSCGEHDHDHDHHDHDHPAEGHVHDENVTAGPNGGHVVKSEAGFAFEVVVDEERKAYITMLDKNGKAVAPGEVTISGIAGERSDPVKLTFLPGVGEHSDKLLCLEALPAGAHVPMVLQIKTGPDAEPVTERFELHLH